MKCGFTLAREKVFTMFPISDKYKQEGDGYTYKQKQVPEKIYAVAVVLTVTKNEPNEHTTFELIIKSFDISSWK